MVNGKGDSERPANRIKFEKNYEDIKWDATKSNGQLKYSKAEVTSRDGRTRSYICGDLNDEVFHWVGKKWVYCLWAEPEGRGFVVMYNVAGTFLLAPPRMQPLKITAKTWAGTWQWGTDS